jgi:cyclopropane-fatty-acyl-phospholipid synthase
VSLAKDVFLISMPLVMYLVNCSGSETGSSEPAAERTTPEFRVRGSDWIRWRLTPVRLQVTADGTLVGYRSNLFREVSVKGVELRSDPHECPPLRGWIATQSTATTFEAERARTASFGSAPSDAVVRRARRPGRLDRLFAEQLQRTVAPARVRVELWDGSSPGLAERIGDLVVRDRGALIGLVVNPDLQFGEMYSGRRIELRGELREMLEALSRLNQSFAPTLRERLALWLAPANDLLSSSRNARYHYDLGNDFYQLWLDSQLVYTCAYYPEPDTTLEAAQIAKLDLVCRKLQLQPGERVLEAGCGWGALALHMARHYGVNVKAFNVSVEQINFARDRAAREGLTDRVEFIEDDYRNATGRFDVAVSVGMLEHVGRRNLTVLSEVLRRTLKRDTGRGLLHFIGRDRPRPLNAWICRRIFPGAYPPTLAEVMSSVLEPADMSVLDVENLRLHYARTLTHWRERFERSEATIRASLGDRFFRAWHLYLAGSEATFTTGWLQLFQIVFAPSWGRTTSWTRAALYTASEQGA